MRNTDSFNIDITFFNIDINGRLRPFSRFSRFGNNSAFQKEKETGK